MIVHKTNHGIQSMSTYPNSNWMGDEWVYVPSVLENKLLSLVPFFVLKFDGETLVDIEDDPFAREEWEDALSPAERRKFAYQTELIIPWEGDMLTVDAAAALWVSYAAEDSAVSEQLTTLIAEAKQKIRDMYPDEN